MKRITLSLLALFVSAVSIAQKEPFSLKEVKPLPPKSISERIERTIDDFENQIKINSPSDVVELLKYIEGKKTTYYLSLTTYGNTVSLYQKDVYILFQDGTKWHKISKIDCDVSDDTYRYTSWITLSAMDLAILKVKKIKKIRLYIYDTELDEGTSDDFVLFTNEIIKMK